MFFIAIILICVTFYLLNEFKNRERNAILAKISSPPAWKILGHAPYLMFKKNHEIFEVVKKMNETQPPVWRIQTPFINAVYINDVKIVEKILSSTKFNNKAGSYTFFVPWLGNGLLTSNGEKWHQRRKIITPAFHFKILDNFVEIMEKHGEIFIEKLKDLNGNETDVFPLISHYALDVICETAMSYELNSQINGEQEYTEDINELTKNLLHYIMDFAARFKFLPKGRRMAKRREELIRKVHNFTMSVINQRKKFLTQNGNLIDKRKLAFLDLLLQAEVDGKPLDDEGIREEVDTFMFGGHDTTTSGIAFALYNLTKHPEIQEKVYDECVKILRYKKSATMHDLNKLNYLEKVIKENLRLYPPVPFISRGLQKPETIEGITLPNFGSIVIPIYFLGRNPKLFKDPLKFDPSRFDKEENIKLFSFIPFSGGSRGCVGQKFAMLEMKSTLAKVVRNFKISVSEKNSKITLASELVLRSTNGINLGFIERKKI